MSEPAAKLRTLIEALPADLGRQAVTHASWTDAEGESYERLAFLGDSVLGLAVSSYLFPVLEAGTAGRMTKVRAQVVSRVACARVAAQIGVPDRLKAASPRTRGRGRSVDQLLRSSNALGEATEAAIGACFLHHGFDATAEAVREAFAPHIDDAAEHLVDFKSELQERLAREGNQVIYRVASETGPPHERIFEVEALVGGLTRGTGMGTSKKAAEQAAAEQALQTLDA